jgi:hypothetical protein
MRCIMPLPMNKKMAAESLDSVHKRQKKGGAGTKERTRAATAAGGGRGGRQRGAAAGMEWQVA